MTRTEHLLTILMEECLEVAHRASKALRFGPDEIQSGQSLRNEERITEEWFDLCAVMEMLHEGPIVISNLYGGYTEATKKKKAKVEEFLLLSKKQRTLTG